MKQKHTIMQSIIINNGKGFIKNFNIGGFIIPQFGDIKEAKRFNSHSEAKAAIGNLPNCRVVKDIWNL